jgi:hypothetical protein
MDDVQELESWTDVVPEQASVAFPWFPFTAGSRTCLRSAGSARRATTGCVRTLHRVLRVVSPASSFGLRLGQVRGWCHPVMGHDLLEAFFPRALAEREYRRRGMQQRVHLGDRAGRLP